MIFLRVVVLFFLSIAASLLIGSSSAFDAQIFWILRLPRTLVGIGVGGGLAVVGAVAQAILQNPLADPFTLGVSSAAALGAVIGGILHVSGILGASGFALFFAVGCVFAMSIWLQNSFHNATAVLLVGVVAGLFFHSIATILLVFSNPAQWHYSMGWLLGSIGNQSLNESFFIVGTLVFATLVAWGHWKALDLMAVDQTLAENSGVNVGAHRKRLFFLVSLSTAVCVASSGIIGFHALIVPHFLRQMGVRSHSKLIPLCFVIGAAFLLVADVVGRVLARPAEVPVGVITAAIGAPIFLLLLRRRGI